jgi:hypothetical protein
MDHRSKTPNGDMKHKDTIEHSRRTRLGSTKQCSVGGSIVTIVTKASLWPRAAPSCAPDLLSGTLVSDGT